MTTQLTHRPALTCSVPTQAVVASQATAEARIPRNRSLAALFALAVVSSGGCGAPTVVDLTQANGGRARVVDSRQYPGRVAVGQAPATITAAVRSCESVGACKAGAVVTIGRSLAGFRSYPKQITMKGAIGHGWRGREAQASSLVALMDRAFSPRVNLGAVHLDVYADPNASANVCHSDLSKPCAYVAQREPPWARLGWDSFSASRAYLAHNTFGAALNHFATRYAPTGKRIYVQLHEPNDCAAIGPGGEHRCHERISNAVRRVLAVDGATKRLGNTLSFVSLSRHVLVVARQQADDMGVGAGRIQYILIAGAHFAGSSASEAGCGIVAASTQVLDKARQRDRAWMAATPWLNAVWVRPRCFQKATILLRAVNRARAHVTVAAPTPVGNDTGAAMRALPPISLGVATNAWPQARTAAWLKRGFAGRSDPKDATALTVSSLLFDIDED